MARRPGLGKGLDALIPGGFQQIEPQFNEQMIVNIPVERIVPNSKQPRGPIDPSDLIDLAASIKEHGVLQPIIVKKIDGADQFMLVAGERRWRASIHAGVTEIPAIVRETTQQELLELALIENVQREDLNPFERAQAYHQLIEEFSLTHEDIAHRVGKSRVSITNTIRLLNLSEKAKIALLNNIITEGHARTLLSLPNQRSQDLALDTILKNELNVRQTEALISKLAGMRPQAQPAKEKPNEIKDIENRLRSIFKTKVNLQPGKKGGSITIFYYSDEELNSIIDRINGLE